MRKLIFCFGLLVCGTLLLGQELRNPIYKTIDTAKFIFDYQYSLQQDSDSKKSTVSIPMRLLVGDSVSLFLPQAKYYTDSLFSSGVDFLRIMGIHMQLDVSHSALTEYYMLNNYPMRGKQTLLVTLLKNYVKAIDSCRIDWFLTEEMDSINGFQCKRAICHFAGRDYVAWYTMEVPVNEGPYKFKGLPGLIVKISDTERQHCFLLERIQKVTQVPIRYNLHFYVKAEAKEIPKIYYNYAAKGVNIFGSIKLSSEDRAFMNKRIKSYNNFIEKTDDK